MLLRLCSKATMLMIACVYVLTSASTAASEKLKVSGFIGVGYASTSDNNFLGQERSNVSIFEMGLSANYRISNNLTFTGQIGKRKFGESFTDENPRIDFASLNYFSNALQMGEQSISLGRVKVPAGFYNVSRDVPSTRASILLPQSVYLDIFRNSTLSVDGLQFNTTNDVFDGILFIDASIGRPQIDDNFNQAMFGRGSKGDWTIDMSTRGHISFENDTSSLAITYSHTDLDYEAKAGDSIIYIENVFEIPIVDGEVELKTLTLSAQFNFGQLEWTTEYMDRKVSVYDFVGNRGKVLRPQEGYYTQLRYPLTRDITVFTRWERFYRNANDKKRQRETVLDAPLWTEITTSLSVGATYRFDRNWQVSAEVHTVNGSAWLPPFFLTTPESAESKDWTLSAIQITYRF